MISAACSSEQLQPDGDVVASPNQTFEPIPQAEGPRPELTLPVGSDTQGTARPILSDASEQPESGVAEPSEGNELSEPISDDVYAELPKLVAVETLPSGLRVGWTEVSHAAIVDTLYVEQQWIDMQTCLGVSAEPPLVVLTQGSPKPLAATDDVLRYIDGSVTAVAGWQGDNAVLQVQIDDLDHSGRLGSHGSSLRQIMARHVWFANRLDERDYPHTCARNAN